MNLIHQHLNKDNLHHAYLIEGKHEEIVPEILSFVKSLGIEVIGNPNVTQITLDSFKIEDARHLRAHAVEKSFSVGHGLAGGASAKKIFMICANNFLLEAQNSLLKIFEEPIGNTHFFVIVPDAGSLLQTLISRFYFISAKTFLAEKELQQDVEKFIKMPLKSRIDFIKELLIDPEEEDEEGNKIIVLHSTRFKAINFLNALEVALHKKIFIERAEKEQKENSAFLIPFRQIFLVRKFLRQPGSSTKTLMESVAMVIPSF